MKSLKRRKANLSSIKVKTLIHSYRVADHLGILKCLMTDVTRHLAGVDGLERDLLTVEARLEHEGLPFLAKGLVSFGQHFDRCLDEGHFTAPAGFKTRRGEVIPAFLQGITSKVFHPTTGRLRGDYSIEAISLTRQIVFFWRKLETPPERTKVLTRETILKFLKCESRIGAIAPFRLDHISRVSQLFLSSLDDFQELDGRHGPGAVAEGYKSNQKWSYLLSCLSDLDSGLEKIGYDVPYGLRYSDLESSSGSFRTSNFAKLACVPKTYSSLRTITVEPTLNQFVQQALGDHLRKEFSRCSVTRQCLALTDQSLNQKLAIEGSRTRKWVTIDLTSASDLLSLQLVESAFACRPRFLSAIKSCRTSFVQVENSLLEMKKFAGMGNATTFPVQSYVFMLIAFACMIPIGKVPNSRELMALARKIRVYGDDIIIHPDLYPAFAEWIASCGLEINHKKTFSKGNFRESCGVDAFGGTNVTPLYLRSDPSKTSTEPRALVSVLSLCNRLWLQGMYSTSKILEGYIKKSYALPLVSRESQALGYHTRQNVLEYQRWSQTLHRFEVRSYVPVTVRKPDSLDGEAALLKFFHTPRLAEYDVDHLSSSVRRFNLNLRKRWVSAG